MKKYSFLIISLFISSTLSYAQKISEPALFDIMIAESIDPGNLTEEIVGYDGLVRLFTAEPCIYCQRLNIDSGVLINSKIIIESLYTKLGDLMKETEIEIFEFNSEIKN